MRATLLGIAVVLAGCSSRGGGGGWTRFQDCDQVRPEGAAAPAPGPVPADDDFARLLAYRSYYSLDAVGAYEHHFAIWFHCIEPTVSYYAVSPEGTVRNAGGWWGGMGVRNGDPPPVPAEQLDNGRLVGAAHERDYDGASGEQLQYLGSYREIAIGEVVPDDGPGDPYQRMVWHQTVTVRADADLTAIDGTADLSGGYTKMCWADTTYRDCSARHWIEFVPVTGVGRPQLAALVSDGSPQPADERARFAAITLAAARARVAGEPGASIDSLLAAQGTTFLPAGFTVPAVVSFTIYARGGKGVDQEGGALGVTLPAEDIARGTARASDRTTLAGLTFTVDVEAALVDPLPAGATGEQKRDVRIRYTLRDGRKTVREAEVVAPAVLWIDGDSVAFRYLSLPDEANNHTHDPPFAQHFPGAEGHDAIDAYVGLAAAPDPWYPK